MKILIALIILLFGIFIGTQWQLHLQKTCHTDTECAIAYGTDGSY